MREGKLTLMGRLHMKQALCKTKPWECEICHTKQNLNVHHKDHNPSNYDISNLMILCRDCHNELHEPDKTVQRRRHLENRIIGNELAKWQDPRFLASQDRLGRENIEIDVRLFGVDPTQQNKKAQT